MKLFDVRGNRSGFIFKEMKRIFPMLRAKITAHIVLEFTPTTLLEWDRLSEKEKKDLIRTVASKELTIEDLIVEILER